MEKSKEQTQSASPAPDREGNAATTMEKSKEQTPEETAAAETPRTALYHFEDGNGLHAVPCEAIPEDGGTYTIVRNGVPVVTGAPSSDEPKSGHVIL